MREIEFRAWSDDYARYVYSDEVDLDVFWRDVLCGDIGAGGVEQYTGLKDKNGKKIFEGDILDDEEECVFVVVWNDASAKFQLQNLGYTQYTGEGGQEVDGDFGVIDQLDFSDFVSFLEWAKVIGNIHENADLLEGE